MANSQNNAHDTEPITITENDIIQFLIDNSSRGHMVSAREIYAAMYKLRYNTDQVDNWSDNAAYNMFRTLDKLISRPPESFYYGLRVCEAKIPGSMAKDSKDMRRYYVEGPLSDSQIRILRDAVSVYSFADPKETQAIVNGLNRLTPEYNQEVYDSRKVAAIKYRGSCFKNIDEINKALSTTIYQNTVTKFNKEDLDKEEEDSSLSKPVNTIRFKYCGYNSKKELVVRRPKFSCDENDPDIREVNPVRLMWTNGFYYLVTCMPSKKYGILYTNYRVDRMIDVKCTDNPAMLPPDKFNEVKFKNANPVMYSENDKYAVSMICSKDIINNVIDTFGFDAEITDIDENRVRVDIPSTSPSGVKMWALEYGYACEILSPLSLRSEMKKAAENLMRTYDREPTKL